MEDAIWRACNDELRDFSEAEQDYIRTHDDFREELLRWYECTLSDGAWTEANCTFLRSFYFNNLQVGTEAVSEPLKYDF
jgi:hypothetical protein